MKNVEIYVKNKFVKEKKFEEENDIYLNVDDMKGKIKRKLKNGIINGINNIELNEKNKKGKSSILLFLK